MGKKRIWKAAFSCLLIAGILLAFPGCGQKTEEKAAPAENQETVQAAEQSPYQAVFEKYGIAHEDVVPESGETGCFVYVNQKSKSVHTIQFFYQDDVVTGLREVLYMKLLRGDQAEKDNLEEGFARVSEEANSVTGASSQWGSEPGYFWLCIDYTRMDEKSVLEEINRFGMASIDLSNAEQVGFKTTREGFLEAGYLEK